MAHCCYISAYPAEVPFLDDRDFLYREVTQKLPGGIHIIFGQSLTLEEEAAFPDVPHPKKVIRGEMGASGGYPCKDPACPVSCQFMLLCKHQPVHKCALFGISVMFLSYLGSS